MPIVKTTKAHKTSISIEGIFGDALRGIIDIEGPLEDTAVQIFEREVEIGSTQAARSGAQSHWSFSWQLAPHLFDGLPHRLRVQSTAGYTQFVFFGDPAINADDALQAPEIQIMPPRLHDAAQLDLNVEHLRRQTGTLLQLLSGEASKSGRIARLAPADLVERYGTFFPEAATKLPRGKDFVWLGVINYDFRIQRPQHLTTELADAGHRVFYIAIQFEAADEKGRFRIEAMPHRGVYIVRLRLADALPKNIYGGFTDIQIREIHASLDEALRLLDVTEPLVVVEYPSWHQVAAGIPGATVVHDCLDYVGGFENVPQAMIDLEQELLKNADAVIAVSEPLAQHLAPREAVVVRNAADVTFFAQAARFDQPRGNRRPVIGYYGAIAEWFEAEWIAHCAKSHPEWDFILIGRTLGADLASLDGLENVALLGEQPYATLPDQLAKFDVATIPFKLNKLIECTNPVKLYEYMAAGKPVVAAAMPEVVHSTPLAYVAHDAEEFELQIEKALAEDTPALRRERNAWAQGHTWRNRARQFLEAIEPVNPKVSVVILTFNHWDYTEACLHSVLTLSDYSNLEIIVVDNASTDGTPENLERFRESDPRVSVIRNKRNLGFAAGNNVGLRAATGDYLILLNNDTYVTRGWVRDLIRPMMLDRSIGMTGPLTNNIGNEQKIKLEYGDMQEMSRLSRAFVRAHLRERFEARNLAFFCVALQRDVFKKVGPLDKKYGLGFFEDDDYCQRVLQAGYRIEIVDDVFVHHHLSASFSSLGAERKKAQMERNKAIYEKRWGPWKPHVYRDALGFG